jgi:hypothetical protein
VRPKLSAETGTCAGQPVPCLQKQGSAVPAQREPTFIHDAWAGWRFELPTENDTRLPCTGVQELENTALRRDRVIAEFRVESAQEATIRVSEAVALAEMEAYAEQTRGVLITRHDFGVFSISLSSMVPFGITMEQDVAPSTRRPGFPPAQHSTFNVN